jgi:hypothetical protein
MNLFYIERGFYSRTEIGEIEIEGKTVHIMNAVGNRTCLAVSEISSDRLNFGCCVDFGHFLAWRAGTNSRYSTGESSPIKDGQPEPSPHLGTA